MDSEAVGEYKLKCKLKCIPSIASPFHEDRCPTPTAKRITRTMV